MQVTGFKCKMEQNKRIKPTKEVKSAQKELQLAEESQRDSINRRESYKARKKESTCWKIKF